MPSSRMSLAPRASSARLGYESALARGVVLQHKNAHRRRPQSGYAGAVPEEQDPEADPTRPHHVPAVYVAASAADSGSVHKMRPAILCNPADDARSGFACCQMSEPATTSRPTAGPMDLTGALLFWATEQPAADEAPLFF